MLALVGTKRCFGYVSHNLKQKKLIKCKIVFWILPRNLDWALWGTNDRLALPFFYIRLANQNPSRHILECLPCWTCIGSNTSLERCSVGIIVVGLYKYHDNPFLLESRMLRKEKFCNELKGAIRLLIAEAFPNSQCACGVSENSKFTQNSSFVKVTYPCFFFCVWIHKYEVSCCEI